MLVNALHKVWEIFRVQYVAAFVIERMITIESFLYSLLLGSEESEISRAFQQKELREPFKSPCFSAFLICPYPEILPPNRLPEVCVQPLCEFSLTLQD